jgi:membrane protein DedA with SNARE-associated domain
MMKFKTNSNSFRIVVFIITIILLVIVWKERELIENYSKLGYLGVFIVNFISNATIIFPLPGAASSFVAGSIWNPLLVGLFSGIGAALGELFGYFVGFGGRAFIVKTYKRNNKRLEKIEIFFRKHDFITIMVLAALPIPFFDFVGILAGALNYPVIKFLIATAIGRIARDIVFAWTGAKIL